MLYKVTKRTKGTHHPRIDEVTGVNANGQTVRANWDSNLKIQVGDFFIVDEEDYPRVIKGELLTVTNVFRQQPDEVTDFHYEDYTLSNSEHTNDFSIDFTLKVGDSLVSVDTEMDLLYFKPF